MYGIDCRGFVQQKPKTALAFSWIVWKSLLLFLALTSPGVGYDTSTDVLFAAHDNRSQPFIYGLKKLIRWDAVYFSQIARRGYLFEQEWAFGWGFTRVLSLGGNASLYISYGKPGFVEAMVGVFIAHVSHLLSVMILYELSQSTCTFQKKDQRSKFAFLASLLHIISPAGLFLSAPYAESPFALLNFLGFHLYFKGYSYHAGENKTQKNVSLLASGFTFGMATTFRSNGLLSGLIFACDASWIIWTMWRSRNLLDHLGRFCATIVGGCLIALGSVIPQYLAYHQYCSGGVEDGRPWCRHVPPSIYGWVQSHYWGVGFLGYWTLSNLPLFLLAGPMLYILLSSALPAWIHTEKLRKNKAQLTEGADTLGLIHEGVIRRLAVPQMFLAILALTTYHVQVISRLASAYPLWYMWLASIILEDRRVLMLGKHWSPAEITVRWMICYALIQGGLFASFLPPA